MIVGTGLVCGALPFQILDLRNAASKCVEIFSEWTFLISHSFSFKNISMKLWSGYPKEQKCWQIITLESGIDIVTWINLASGKLTKRINVAP